MTVLLVEDDDVIAASIKEAMQNTCFTVVGSVRSVPAALLAAQHTLPQFAVVDLRLARGEGLTVARTLREKLGTTVLFATAYPHLLGILPEAEGLAVISKPFDPAHVPLALIAAGDLSAGHPPRSRVPPGFQVLGLPRPS